MSEVEATPLPGVAGPQDPEQGGLFEHAVDGNDAFSTVALRARYTPDNKPLESFYVPMLSRATKYDRAVGYWSAAELRFAAQGTARFLANGGRMRLIVGAQLKPQDIDAVLQGEPLSDVLAARLLADPELEGTKIVADHHLSVLAWMVAHDRLEIRVGVPTDGTKLLSYAQSGKYFHTKYGVFTDRHGNRVAFTGSNNATVSGWVANHETFDVFPSWMPVVWNWNGVESVRDFERHWNNNPDAGWAIVPLPTAVREHLITNAPERSPAPVPPPDPTPSPGPSPDLESAWGELLAVVRAPRESPYTAVGTAAVVPLPHQAVMIDRAVGTYPRGYLLADEVGLGKTIEAGLVIRELMLSGRASKALLLVPASVMKQWQEELHEKMNLVVPRYDKGAFFDRHDQPVDAPAGASPWSAFPIVLASSHLARRKDRRQQILDAGPWDVVFVDEAHHARRRGSKPSDTPNSLLALLLDMRDKEMWQALYLASATPMQMNAHEVWDLLSLFRLTGKWGDHAKHFLGYYERLRQSPETREWRLLSDMLNDYFTDPAAETDARLEEKIEDDLGWGDAFAVTSLTDVPPSSEQRSLMPNSMSRWMDEWLRRHTPLRDRIFRNTRQTLRDYQVAGIIGADMVIPIRHVDDEFIPLAPNEEKLYERIEEYIRRHYNAYQGDKGSQALGFIMTVYRRRLTSSFEAIKRSLQRRLAVLEGGKGLIELLAEDDNLDIEDTLFDPEAFDVTADRLHDEIQELRSFLAELDTITGEDSKATQLVHDLFAALETYTTVVVFTQYTDTLEYIRDRLIAAQITSVGCYSGRGGEIYNPATDSWDSVTKADLKNRFREGQVTVLIGTDAMSEGLNLQTCGRLINYDMPWNLMRVEQRIGRVDRIGATYKDIQVTNYFYKGTVEQRVYEGILGDYNDFTELIGDAAPVLANVEKVLEQLALTGHTDAEVTTQVEGIRADITDLTQRAIQKDDLGNAHWEPNDIEAPPVLEGTLGLADLERVLTRNMLTGQLFERDPKNEHLYSVTVPGSVSAYSLSGNVGVEHQDGYQRGVGPKIRATFDRATADMSPGEVVLLTLGTPELDALLPIPEKS